MRPSLTLIACALAAATAASALAADRNFPVGGFDKLSVQGPYTVNVRTGARPSVNARGPQQRLERLKVERRGGTLVISTIKGNWGSWSMGSHEDVVIDITVPMLSAATLTGSGDVSIDRIKAPAFEAALTGSGDLTVAQLETGRLAAIVTGSGDMTLSGHAANGSATLRGSGDLDAARLGIDMLTASVTGSGDLKVGPARTANVSLTGSGNIDVAGRPKCAISKRGSGDVRCGG